MGEDEPQVWPVWGRVLFWVIVVVVLAASLFAAVNSGRLDARTLRIVASVVLVPGIALLVVALISRRTASRSVAQLDVDLAEVLREVGAEEARQESSRTSGASSLSLHAASTSAGEARQRLGAHDLDGAVSSVGHLADAAAGWDPSSQPAQAVAACRRTATKLTRARDRARRTTR